MERPAFTKNEDIDVIIKLALETIMQRGNKVSNVSPCGLVWRASKYAGTMGKTWAPEKYRGKNENWYRKKKKKMPEPNGALDNIVLFFFVVEEVDLHYSSLKMIHSITHCYKLLFIIAILLGKFNTRCYDQCIAGANPYFLDD